MGVAGQGAAAVALGGAGHRVGAGPRDDGRIENDGPAGQLVRRSAGGHAIHSRGGQVFEVRQGAGRAVAHVVAGGAGDGVGRVGRVVRAQAVAAEGVVVLNGGSRRGHAMAGRALGEAVEGPHPAGRHLTAVAAHVGAGERGRGEGGSTGLGVEGGGHRHGTGGRRRSGPRVGVGVVGGRTRAIARMAGVAGQRRGQVHVLGVGPGDAGEGRARGALGQAGGARMAGQAGARACGHHGRVGQGVALGAEGGPGHRGSAGVGVAAGAVRRELGGRDVQVPVALVVDLARQERDGVRHTGAGPVIGRRGVDVGVAGERTAPVALGGAGHGVGARPRDDGGVEDDGPAGQLIRRRAGGHAVHGRGVQVLEVRQGTGRAVGHVVAGGAGNGVRRVRGIVRAQAVAAEGIVVLRGAGGRSRHGMAGRALGAAVEGAHGPVRRRLASVTAHVGTGQGGAIEGGITAGLGPEGGVDAHTGRPRELPEPGVGVVIVLEGATAAAGVAGVAAQPGGEVHVLQVGARDAGIARTSGAFRQAAGAGVAGAAGARIGARQGGIRQRMALLTERGRRGGRGPRVGMARGAVGGKGRGRHGHVPIAPTVGHAAQEGDRVGRDVVVVAEGGVETARLGARGRRDGGVADRIVGRAQEVALGADGGVGGVGGHVGEGGS